MFVVGLLAGLVLGAVLWWQPSQEKYQCVVIESSVEPVLQVRHHRMGEYIYIVVILDKWHPFSPVLLKIVDESYRETVYEEEVYVDNTGSYHGTIPIKVREMSEKYRVVAIGYTYRCNYWRLEKEFGIK